MPLQEAIDGAIKVYEKEHRHAAPAEAVAQHLGYKNANNGAAVKAMASIRYYGLFERPSEGLLAVTKELELYQYSPDMEVRRDLVQRWLKTPPVFAELLEKFRDALPSDATLRFELIQRGFLPDAVEAAAAVFRSSVDFAQYYLPKDQSSEPASLQVDPHAGRAPLSSAESITPTGTKSEAYVDRIPVRLPGARRAWLEVPMPFYASDKERLKKQIDLLFTEEDEMDDL